MKLAQLFGGRRKISALLDPFYSGQLPGILAGIGQPPAVAIESFGAGRSALVRRLVLADGRSLVLRAYFAEPAKQPAFSHWYLNRRLADRGFRVPAIHFCGRFQFPHAKADVEVLIEDFVTGERIGDTMRDDPAVRSRLVENLLRLHSDRSPYPGRPWIGQIPDDPLREAMDKTPNRLARVRSLLPDITAHLVKRCTTWFQEQLARRSVPTSFELIHGDFHRENLLLTPDGKIALIDLGRTFYGCFESDLVDARWMYPDHDWWAAFCDHYFAAEPARRERFDKNAPLFFAFYHLTKAARQAARTRQSIEKSRHKVAESCRDKCRSCWNQMLAVIEGRAAEQSESPGLGNDT